MIHLRRAVAEAGNYSRPSTVQGAMKNRSLVAALVLMVLGWISPTMGWAAPGDLDPSFGSGGRVLTNFTSDFDLAAAVAIQPDGKIVAAGSIEFENRFALARYEPDGTLDTSFDGDGKVITSFTSDHDSAQDVAIQEDGKIVAAGTAGGAGFALARYEDDGALDLSFGESGKVVTKLTGGFVIALAVAIQPDGKIVAAGRGAGAGGRFALARYEPDGTLDASFGEGGKVLTNFTKGPDLALAMAIQADGKIVAAGRAAGAGRRFALARYDANGALDPSFGRNGRVFTNLTPGDDAARDVAIQPDGRIVAAGHASGKASRFALTRYMPNGALDPTFGGNGKVFTDLTPGTDIAFGIAIQSDQRILAAGHAGGSRAAPRDHTFAFARYRPNGALDRTFSGNGKRRVNFTPGDDWAMDLAIQPDGRIVAAGRAAGAGGRFALVRLTGA